MKSIEHGIFQGPLESPRRDAVILIAIDGLTGHRSDDGQGLSNIDLTSGQSDGAQVSIRR